MITWDFATIWPQLHMIMEGRRSAQRLAVRNPDHGAPADLQPAPGEGRLGCADDTARESSRAASGGRRRGNLPGTSQAPGPGGTSGSEPARPRRTEGDFRKHDLAARKPGQASQGRLP